MSDSKIIRSKK